MPDDKEMVTASLSFIERVMSPLQSAVLALTESQRELVAQQKAITELFQSRPTRLDIKESFESGIDSQRRELTEEIAKHNAECKDRHQLAKTTADKVGGIDSKLFKFMTGISLATAVILGLGLTMYHHISALAEVIQKLHPVLPK